jgi:hypothetical protein
VTLFNFIIIAYGIHPSCGHACLQRGTYTDKHQIKDQVAPEYLWGLIHQGTRPRINPCPRHGYPGPCPGALDISRGFNCLVPDQEPQSSTGSPYKGLLQLGPRPRTPVMYWGPSQGSLLLGPRPRTPVMYWGPSQGSLLLGPRPRTPVMYWGPSQGSLLLGPRPRTPVIYWGLLL